MKTTVRQWDYSAQSKNHFTTNQFTTLHNTGFHSGSEIRKAVVMGEKFPFYILPLPQNLYGMLYTIAYFAPVKNIHH